MEATLEAPVTTTVQTTGTAPENATTTVADASTQAPAQTPPATLFDGVTPPETPANPLTQPVKSKYVNDDGTLAENWRENLTDPALRQDGTLALFKNINDLAKSFVEKQKMIGKKAERESMPALDAPPEKWTEWRKLTGAPDSPIGYGELRPDNVPKEAWDNELEGGLRAVAHKYAAPPALVKELAEAYTNRQFALQQAAVAMETQRLDKGRAELRGEFGETYQREMTHAVDFARTIGLDHENPALRAVFSEPLVYKAFASAYRLNLMGDKAEGVKDGMNGFGNSIDDKISALRKSPAYKGEEGPARQAQFQADLHQLMSAKSKANQPLSIAS
jgi:hypothetical protein